VKQRRSIKHTAVAILHTTAMMYMIVMLEAMWAPHLTGISNVELLHEIKDRTRVLKRIKCNKINVSDMNDQFVSDGSQDSYRSM
jgi:hypothetical protein